MTEQLPADVAQILDEAGAGAAFDALPDVEKRAMLAWIDATEDPVHRANRTKMAIDLYCSPDT
jgi:hypothetical protein